MLAHYGRILTPTGRALAAVGLPPALALAALWGATIGGGTLVWGTPLLQFVPWRELAVESYRAGVVPLWNPLVGAGAPLAANVQSAVFYPLNAIYFVLSAWDAGSWGAALHLALAGWFGYLFFRLRGLRPAAALFGALIYECSGPVVTRAHFSSMISATPWLPVSLGGVELLLLSTIGRARIQPSRPLTMIGIPVLAVGLAMPLLAGHAQLAAMFALLAAGYGAVRLWKRKPAVPALLRTMLAVVGAGLLTVGLTSAQIIASIELIRLSARAEGVDFGFGLAYSLPPIHLLGLVLPDFFGNPTTGIYRGYGTYYEFATYVGIPTLGLAAFAALTAGRRSRFGRSELLFWMATAVMTMVFALGVFTPVYPWLFERVPGFDLFQAPARWLYITAFALAVLSAIGLDRWLGSIQEPSRARSRWRPEAAVAALGLALLVSLGPIFVGIVASPVHQDVLFGILRLGGLLMLAGGSFALARRRGEGAPVLVVLVLDLALFAGAANPAAPADVYATASSWRDAPALRRFTSEAAYTADFFELMDIRRYTPPAGGWKVVRERGTPNVGMLDGIREVFNYDPPELATMRSLRRAADGAGDPDRLLRLFAAGEVRRTSAGPVESVADPLPRAHLVDEVQLSSGDGLAAVLGPAFDPRSSVVISEADASRLGRVRPPSTPRADAGPGSVDLTDLAPDRIEARVIARRDAVLVLADAWYPGWVATVDGQPAPLVRANFAFRAVPVPAGEHEVLFQYRPWWWPALGYVTAVSWLLASGAVVSGLGRRPKIVSQARAW